MKIPTLSLLLACCASIVSCEVLEDDYISLHLLMGRDSQAFTNALGTPKEREGTLQNGTIKWFDDYATDTEYGFAETYVTFEKNRGVLLRFKGDIPATHSRWRKANAQLIELYYACNSNDLDDVKELLAQYPQLRERETIIQAAAQAARSASPQVCNYLVAHYQLDIHAPIMSPIDTHDGLSGLTEMRLVLMNTSIAKLTEYGKRTNPRKYSKAMN